MFDLEAILHNKSVRVAAVRQAEQMACDVQRDVYESHRHRVFAIAFYMTGNELEAEQILTTTFVDAFRTAAEPQASEVDGSLVEELRRRFPLGEMAAAPELKTQQAGAELAGRNVRRTDLEEAIRELPPTERFLFLLRDVEGYTPAAIARLLDMPEAKVQRGLFSARIRLRQALAASRDAEPQAA